MGGPLVIFDDPLHAYILGGALFAIYGVIRARARRRAREDS